MSISSFRSTSRPKRTPARPTPPPPPWPVDPAVRRRIAETSARIERTRRQLALHVLPGRKGEPER
jgi:hypothetical protein